MSVEIIWEKILSREAEQVKAAFLALDADMRQKVRAHLQAMCTEEGWHPEQRLSAQKGLDIIGKVEKE